MAPLAVPTVTALIMEKAHNYTFGKMIEHMKCQVSPQSNGPMHLSPDMPDVSIPALTQEIPEWSLSQNKADKVRSRQNSQMRWPLSCHGH